MRNPLLIFCTLLFLSSVTFALQAPVVLEPAEGAVISGQVLTVKWEPLEAGHWAQIEVAGDAAFTRIIAKADRLTGTEWQYAALPRDGKRYYWRIRSRALSDNPDEGEPYPEGEGEDGGNDEGEKPDPTDPVDPTDPNEGERPGPGPSDKSGGCGKKNWVVPKELLSDWLEWNFWLW
ncbi:MAG: hypothetical protein GX130_01910 [Candidatus Hydrogenedens sp.]|jgi:hypothetical protein|nr:hypothetical protein [Candidatus Hydrogenedens sp.]